LELSESFFFVIGIARYRLSGEK